MRVKLLIAAGAGLAGFTAMLCLFLTGNAHWIDDPVRELLYGLRSSGLTAVMKVITYMGNWQTVTALCIVLLLIGKTRITYGIPLAAGAAFVTLLNRGVKLLVERPRPEDITHLIEEGGFSFASHSAIPDAPITPTMIAMARLLAQRLTLKTAKCIFFILHYILENKNL